MQSDIPKGKYLQIVKIHATVYHVKIDLKMTPDHEL